MDQQTIQALAQLLSQFGVSAIFVWAWMNERRERQLLLEQFAARLDKLSGDYLALLREIWRERIGLPAETMNGKEPV